MRAPVLSVIALVALVALVASSWTITRAQGVDSASAAQWQYERDTLAAALRSTRAQLEELDSVPKKVRDAFKAAQADAVAFRDEARAGHVAAARRHHRAATRALARISRWVVEQDAAADAETTDDAQPLEHRARVHMKRLSTRYTKLARKAAQLELDLDLAPARGAAALAKQALAARDLEAARASLKALAAALEALEEEIRSAMDVQADAEVQP